MDLINQPQIYESAAKNIPEEKRDRLRVSGKEFVIGTDYDRIDVTYPSPTQELYTYSLSASTILTIEVNYTSSSKKDILNLRKV